ncbi:hypothetical protein [Streptomyces sp. NPDC059460]|uniref:hypothetical protein n=1 Tax=Streptomyces sp. NPDC059460 TaxID=3346840 RepID=UPI00367C98F7
MTQRPRLGHALVAGWVVLALGGWGVTQWLGEPVATEGPRPARPPASGAEPGPQPDHWHDGACADDAKATPAPHPSASAARLLVVDCARPG